MKKIAKILSIFLIFIFAFIISACGGDFGHTHDFDNWEITIESTYTETGHAVKTCSCGQSLEQELPTLTDTTTWTLINVTDATCVILPSETYSSVYGEITVITGDYIDHNYEEWYIFVDPTFEELGTYKHDCTACEHYETEEIPNLTDSIWNKIESVEAECDVEGYDLFESSYGQVKVSYGMLEHNYPNEWEIIENPNYENDGLARKDCPDCEAYEELVLPNLNNEEYWTILDQKETSYNEGGFVSFKSKDVEYTHYIEKLVAPYDGKTYSSFAVDADDNGIQKNGVVLIETVWSNASVTLDQNGVCLGEAHPFRGQNVFKMVDPKTGKLAITLTNYHTNEETGESELNPEDVKTYNAFVDFESGLVVRANSASFDYVHVYTPFEIAMNRENANASSWDKAIAIEYTFEETTYTIFCYKDVVYFNVKFVDETGNNVPANECYNSEYLYVLDKNDELIEGFVYNGEKLVVVDGYEGTYTNENNVLFVSGYGVVTLNDANGTYEPLNETTLGIYVNNEYYEVVLSETAYTITKPMVNVTFDAGTYATVEGQAYNKNIVTELPVPTTLTHTFKGWFYDAECKDAVEEEFKPLEDCTLYANWKPKVVINLVGVLEGDDNVLYLGAGDIIGEYLPTYGVELDVLKMFKGWYLDSEYVNSLPEEVEVTEEDTNISIYAKWEDLPAYYGSYKGSEIWNASYGNSGGKTLNIDENGKITGQITGEVVSYDEATQKITWKPSNSTTTKTFYFNEKLGIIAGIYSSYDISNDYYIFSRADADGKANSHYGIQTAKAPGEANRNYYAQFVNITTDLGDVELFMYNNYIYDTFTATDALGNKLTSKNVKDAKSLIVKDADGNIIVSVASIGDSFATNSSTIDLDPYFGTYLFENEEVVLDGTGTIVYGEKIGTYTLALEGSEYQFDVYFNDNTEYYELTLNENNCNLVKPMVSVTYEEGTYANIEDVSVNKNILFTLPVLESDTHVFNGWYYDSEFKQEVGSSLLPKENITLYALWKVKFTLTINKNNGEEQQVIIYSEGDEANIEIPTLKGMAFVGWYTTESFVEGTEWTAGTKVTNNTEIFAKWEEAPAFYNTYTVTRVQYNSGKVTGASYLYCYKSYSTGTYLFEIDPNGNGFGNNAPFNGNFVIENYNEETGYLEIVYTDSYNNEEVYRGYLDAETGIIITTYVSDSFTQVFFFNPFNTDDVTNNNLLSSYWSDGLYRTLEYVYEENSYTALVMDEVVYFGVTFEDANGNKVAGNDCYTQQMLYVKDANGEIIAKFGQGETQLELMDGNEGTYTNGTDTLVIDGVKTATLNGVAGTYTKADEDAEYGFDVYVDGVYYEVTLNKEDQTCDIVKPMVTITFDAGDKATVDAYNVNKNIEITLPNPTNDNFVFRGWYKEQSYETLVNNKYIPTANETLYAKWDAKVTLTVVYGNTLNDEVLTYGVGDTVAPKEPAFTNGKVFNGWYFDAEFNKAYEIGTITENTIIYCNWMEAVAMYGSYVGFNLWQDSAKETSSISKIQQISADGIASGEKSGIVENYNPETGVFNINNNGTIYYAAYDEYSGVLAFAYGSKSTTLGNDLNIFFKKEAANVMNSITLSTSSYTKLITVVYKDGTSDNILLMNDRLYGGVTWTADGEYTAKTIGNASTFTIYDRNGEVLLTK